LSLASPFQFVLHLPPEVYSPLGLGFVLYAFKRLFGYDLELRTYRQQRRNELIQAEIESRRLQAQLAELDASENDALEPLQASIPDEWRVVDAAIVEADE